MSTEAPHISPHIHPLFFEGGALYLNAHTGRFELIDAEGAEWLRIINQGRTAALKEHLALADPLNAESLSTKWLGELSALGVIGFAHRPRSRVLAEVTPPSEEELLDAGAVIMALESAEPPKLTTFEHTAALKGLRQALQLLKLPFPEMVEAIRVEHAHASQPASLDDATRMKVAVHQAGADYPGRLACLELSAATSLACAEIGLQVNVVIGAAVDPISPHAWPKTQGQAVHLPTDEPIAGMYYPMYEI